MDAFVFSRWIVPDVGLVVTVGLGTTARAESVDDEVMPSLVERFADPGVTETPNIQKHVIPLLSRLGCNGRSCHGSFQGRGGFLLSLFGYDFKADHAAIAEGDSPRVDLDAPEESLIILKPTDADFHEGGKRYDLGSWEHRVLHNWIVGGAKFDTKKVEKLDRLEVSPQEILFSQSEQTRPLKVVAIWADGTREDVTPLGRYTSNDDQVADVDDNGMVSSAEPGDTHVVVAYDKAVVAIPVIRPVSNQTGDNYPDVPTPTPIDELVVEKLRKLGMAPSDLASDEQFLRRVSLDIAGTLPTSKEVRAFLADTNPDKRTRKIEELLETPAYVAKMTTLLCDITGNNDQQLTNVSPMRTAPAQEWYDWIYERVARNEPYDQIAAGIILAKSRLKGESYREYCESMSDLYRDDASYADRDYLTHYWARREFRQPEERAIAFAYAFMGTRIQCAQCHKHPFDVWSKEDFDQFKTFFSGVRFANTPPRNDRQALAEYEEMLADLDVDEELRGNMLRRELGKRLEDGKTVPFPELVITPVRGNAARNPNNRNRRRQPARAPEARILGEETVDLSEYDDAREPVMEWLRRSDNPYFAKAIVNRVWATYFNVGIVHPTDDLSLGNPPSNAPLLDYLADGFVDSGYDLKWLHREITTSRTYQLTWVPNETNRLDTRNFSRAVPRRLPAEVAYDIIRQSTAGDEAMAGYLTDIDRRAISVPGTRAPGDAAYPLQIFGRSERTSNCDCDRSMEATLLQTVFLQNDTSLHNAISSNQSWLGQIERDFKPEKPRTAAQLERLHSQRKRLNNQLKTGKKAIERATAQGDSKKAKELRQKMAAARKRLEQVRDQLTQAETQEKQASLAEAKLGSPAELVEEAYLRTLSRKPTEKELAISLHHLQAAKEPTEGLHDLLWALLNTKEFIVNH